MIERRLKREGKALEIGFLGFGKAIRILLKNSLVAGFGFGLALRREFGIGGGGLSGRGGVGCGDEVAQGEQGGGGGADGGSAGEFAARDGLVSWRHGSHQRETWIGPKRGYRIRREGSTGV